jgi:FKBP-type peptidyl-prolyl cis-trans isomerase FklB|uniref:FKBP-type peptidyl-prolyl cis-trans isomerase n=1 Tax=Cephaloticoccus sp. TaxID=1985742 RepID=UPI00404A7E32
MNYKSILSSLPRLRLAAVPVLGALLLLLPACAKKDAPASKDQSVVSGPVKLETDEQKVSYGIGYNMGADMAHQSGFTTDVAALQAGIADGCVTAEPRVNRNDLQAAFQAIQQRMQALAAEAAKVQQVYLEKNKTRAGVTVTESGLQYEVVTSGNGPHPKATDRVVVDYKGTLIDGTEFDHGDDVEFGLNQVIPGWTEALELMSVGDKWKLIIPSNLAYGPQPQRDIPANSTLLFEIHLKAIK